MKKGVRNQEESPKPRRESEAMEGVGSQVWSQKPRKEPEAKKGVQKPRRGPKISYGSE